MVAQRMMGTCVASLLCVIALSGAVLGQTAATPDPAWAAIVAAARKEGRVNYYSAPNPPAPLSRMGKGFKKAYPDIVIDFQRIPSGPLLSKIDQERAAGADGADVANATEVNWFVARAKEGRLLRPGGPAARDWPAKFPWVVSAFPPR